MTQITIAQAAYTRGVEKSTIWRWIQKYNLQAERIGFVWLIDKEEFMKFQPPQRGPRKKANDES